MSVNLTTTAALIPAEEYGAGVFRLIIAGTGSGDGSGGTISAVATINGIIQPGDLVWAEDAFIDTDDNAAQLWHIVTRTDAWSMLKNALGNVTMGIMGGTLVSVGARYGLAPRPNTPIFLGSLIDPASAYYGPRGNVNTNGKAYNVLARLLVYRPKTGSVPIPPTPNQASGY